MGKPTTSRGLLMGSPTGKLMGLLMGLLMGKHRGPLASTLTGKHIGNPWQPHSLTHIQTYKIVLFDKYYIDSLTGSLMDSLMG